MNEYYYVFIVDVAGVVISVVISVVNVDHDVDID